MNASAVMRRPLVWGWGGPKWPLWPWGSEAEGATDDLLHDLGRPAVDGLHAAVEEGLRDRVLEHVAVAAVQLQAPVDDALLQLGGPPLGHGGVLDGEPPRVVLEDRPLEVGLGDGHPGVHLG